MPRIAFPRPLPRYIMTVLTVLVVMFPATTHGAERIGGVSISEDASLSAAAPAVGMPSGILRTTDGRTLWERDATDERAMASITKVMTALVVLDEAEPGEKVTISTAAAAVGESGVDLLAGQTYTVQQLLESMLVVSANNAAYALAEHVGGSREAFIGMMNAKAAELGLSNTSFTNPHGLDEPGHYSSAADIATLMSVAMSDPRFAAIVGIRGLDTTIDGRTKFYENSNKLLGTYPGMLGGKTGWTNRAGYSVTVMAERDGIGLLAVVLGGTSEDDRFVQASRLLDWGFTHYRMTQVSSAEATAGLIPVTDYLDERVAAVVASDTVVPVFDLEGEITSRVDLLGEVDAPVAAGDRLGTLTVSQGTRLLAQVPVVAAEDVPEPDAWESIGIWFTRAWRTIFGGEQQATPVQMM